MKIYISFTKHTHIVDIEAVDTHRPKIKKSTSIRKINTNLKLKLPAVGASGEIASLMSPIIPISPQLFPKPSNSATTAKATTALTNLDIGDSAWPGKI